MANDFLQNSQFLLSFSKIPSVALNLQTVSVPSLGLSHSQIGTPFSFLKEPDTKVNFSELQVTFKLDENFSTYLEIFNWIMGMSFPEDFEQYANLEQGSHKNIFSDATLTILTNSNIPNLRIEFRDLFPTFLSQVDLAVNDTDATTLDMAASFEYHLFKIHPLTS